MDIRSEEGTIMLEWGIGMIFSIFILMFFFGFVRSFISAKHVYSGLQCGGSESGREL